MWWRLEQIKILVEPQAESLTSASTQLSVAERLLIMPDLPDDSLMKKLRHQVFRGASPRLHSYTMYLVVFWVDSKLSVSTIYFYRFRDLLEPTTVPLLLKELPIFFNMLFSAQPQANSTYPGPEKESLCFRGCHLATFAVSAQKVGIQD